MLKGAAETGNTLCIGFCEVHGKVAFPTAPSFSPHCILLRDQLALSFSGGEHRLTCLLRSSECAQGHVPVCTPSSGQAPGPCTHLHAPDLPRGRATGTLLPSCAPFKPLRP